MVGNVGYVIGGCYITNSEPPEDSPTIPQAIQVLFLPYTIQDLFKKSFDDF